jgi:hypothetical protein
VNLIVLRPVAEPPVVALTTHLARFARRAAIQCGRLRRLVWPAATASPASPLRRLALGGSASPS